MNDIKQWFLDQSPRDQLMMSAGGALVLIYILLFVVLFPMQDSLAKQEKRNKIILSEQTEVLTMAGQLMAIRQPGSTAAEGKQSLNAIVSTTTRDFNLRMENLQPSGNSARVRLGSSDFNSVISWLHELEVNRGLQIKDLSITADATPGSVIVQLQLVQG